MTNEINSRGSSARRIALSFILAALGWLPVRLLARPAAPPLSATRAADEASKKTAGEAFKNIQVLKDIPAEQLLPSMRYITAALGVRCDYCHEPDHFDSDGKPTKERARNMMKMMFAINTDNFNGRREVTCYTCHRGVAKATSTPALPDEIVSGAAPAAGSVPATKPAPKPEPSDANSSETPGASSSLPSADEIFAKYLAAIGGSGAIQKNSSRDEKGNVEGPRGLHATIETFRKAPDKAFAVLHGANGDVTEGVNGQSGWGRRANGELTDEAGDELARSKQWAAFYPGEQFKRDYARFQVRGTEQVNGHDSWVVMAWWPAGGADKLYFDANSSLLLRVTHRIESPLGALPLETDYDDYRAVNGLKIPFIVRVTRVDGTTTYKWQQMDANVPVDDSKFEKPAATPEAKP